jgi:protein TonB
LQARALAVDTMPRTTKSRTVVAALAVSIALHGGGTAWATYCRDPLTVNGNEAVDVDILEPAPAVVVAPPEPTLDPRPEPTLQPKPEPRIVTAHHAPAQTPPVASPPPSPPSFGIRPDETAPEGETAVPIGDPAIADSNARGDARGVDAGVPGGSPGGKDGSVAGGKALPIVGPSYDAAYLNNAPPRYPAAARRMRLQGTVTIRALVGTDGHPQHVSLEKSSGMELLDNAALEAVQRWMFVPARQGTTPVAAEVDMPLRFRLEGMEAE